MHLNFDFNKEHLYFLLLTLLNKCIILKKPRVYVYANIFVQNSSKTKHSVFKYIV